MSSFKQIIKCQQDKLPASWCFSRSAQPESPFFVWQQASDHCKRHLLTSTCNSDLVCMLLFMVIFGMTSYSTMYSKYQKLLRLKGNNVWNYYFFLHERHLAQNPFICDCHLKWLADYLHTNPIETSGARCTSPRRLANKRIGQIKSKKFRCSGNFLSSAAIFLLLAKPVVIEVLMKAAGSLQNY